MKNLIVTTRSNEDTRFICDSGFQILAMYPSCLLVRGDEHQIYSLKKSKIPFKEISA